MPTTPPVEPRCRDAIRGERIFERDGRRLDEFDLHVMRRAGDLAHFERERRRVLLAVGEP